MHHMTHPLGDNTILTDERQTDQLNAHHLRQIRADQPPDRRRMSTASRFGLSIGVVAAAIGLGFALPDSSDTTTVPSAVHVPGNVR
jgi:hypothetical protein